MTDWLLKSTLETWMWAFCSRPSWCFEMGRDYWGRSDRETEDTASMTPARFQNEDLVLSKTWNKQDCKPIRKVFNEVIDQLVLFSYRILYNWMSHPCCPWKKKSRINALLQASVFRLFGYCCLLYTVYGAGIFCFVFFFDSFVVFLSFSSRLCRVLAAVILWLFPPVLSYLSVFSRVSRQLSCVSQSLAVRKLPPVLKLYQQTVLVYQK